MEIYEGDYYQEDLRCIALHSRHGDISKLLLAFIVELNESDEAKEFLTHWSDENDHPWFNVRAINLFQTNGYNIYRLRPLGTLLTRFRVIYLYDNEYDDIYLLAVIEKPEIDTPHAHNRVYNYEPDHFITARIRDEYDQYGFLRIPGRGAD